MNYADSDGFCGDVKDQGETLLERKPDHLSFEMDGSIERVPEGKQKGRTVLKELGKNALSRLCGMQKTASLNFCTPCELS